MFKIRIRKHEIGLWFRHGDFKRPLASGVHRKLPWPLSLGRNKVEVCSVFDTCFEHPMLDVMLDSNELRALLEIVDLAGTERALIWLDGRLEWIVGPGRHAFWKRPYRVEVETFDTTDFEFSHPKLDAILEHPNGNRHLDAVKVESHQRLVLFHKGELLGQRGPGLYVFWKQGGLLTWKVLDMRQQVADVSGQEIMTADKVTLRVNLVVTFEVSDPVQAVTAVKDFEQALYRDAQLVLREVVVVRQLDALLTAKDKVGIEVRDMLAARVAPFGLAVRAVGLRDIILPGDMKSILNQVIEAEKQAEANLIRRREETAAARSQANTAKLLAENPVLARMKELEALQDILAGTKTTFVLGSGDLTEQVGSLVKREMGSNGS